MNVVHIRECSAASVSGEQMMSGLWCKMKLVRHLEVKTRGAGTSLVAQLLRIHLPMQGTRV